MLASYPIFHFLLSPLHPLAPNPPLLNYLIIYLDKYWPIMVTFSLIVRHHARRFSPKSPRSLCVGRLRRPGRGVGACPELLRALDCAFSFVFLSFQRSNLQTFQRSRPNSFPHNSLSDPHPLNPVVSTLYKYSGGRIYSCHPERSEGPAFSLLPYLFISLLLYVVTSILRQKG